MMFQLGVYQVIKAFVCPRRQREGKREETAWLRTCPSSQALWLCTCLQGLGGRAGNAPLLKSVHWVLRTVWRDRMWALGQTQAISSLQHVCTKQKKTSFPSDWHSPCSLRLGERGRAKFHSAPVSLSEMTFLQDKTCTFLNRGPEI